MFPDLFSLPDFVIEFKDIMYKLFIIGYIISAIIGAFILPKLICGNIKGGALCLSLKLYDPIGIF